MFRWAIFFLAWLVCLPAAMSAAVEMEDIQVSILTFGPGPAVYERFGHIAIRLRVEEAGFDYLYDWGNFDFAEPNFVGKFVRGSLLYSMGKKPTGDWLPFYQLEQDRSVTEQVLNLDGIQKSKLIEMLAANEENPNYYYDFFNDNCSTRIRDMIDASANNQFAPQWTNTTTHSYRWHVRRLMNVGADNKVMCLLIDFCFGPRVDKPLTQWQAAFLPMELSKYLDTTQLTRADGSRVPLVKERRLLNTTKRPGNAEPADTTSPVRLALPIGLVLAAVTLVMARIWRPGFWTIASAWSAFAAFGTAFFIVILLFTRHWVVGWNENFLHFSPFSFGVLAAILVPRWRKSLGFMPRLAVGLSVIGLAITISHLTIQQNAPAVCLALPLHLAVMLGWKSTMPSTIEKKTTTQGRDSI